MNDKIKNNLKTDCWFNYQEFYKKIASKNYKVLVEVGVWKGHSITFLAKAIRNNNYDAKIYAVDLWDETYKWKNNPELRNQIPYLYDIYIENKKQSKTMNMITDLKGTSWLMADNFEDNSVDFVFIDADHEYNSVVKDITAWLPKVRKGGIISGHDYDNPCGVKQAVNELIPGFQLSNDGVWFKVIE